jgi:GNAT superfamily N-acetyltransferase
MTDFTIEEIVVPATIDSPDAGPFIEMCEIKNALEEEGYGNDELSYLPSEILPNWQDASSPHRGWGVRVDGTMVARAYLVTSRDDDSGTAWIGGGVLPAYRRRGIGAALFDRVEDAAIAAGLAKLIVYAVSRENDGLRVHAPTGFGSVPHDNAEVQFLFSEGFTLEQVERASRLELPSRVARVDAPDGYRLHYWVGPTPEEWLDDIAVLLTRMSTDAPSAGLEEPEDVWTADRVREYWATRKDSPRTELSAAVEHVASGRLVGFTVLSAPAELNRQVAQEDTLVLREHRGHALGMVLKLANIAHLQRVRPGHPAIITFNAEENRHMLDVNETVGFVPIGYEGAWKKVLS